MLPKPMSLSQPMYHSRITHRLLQGLGVSLLLPGFLCAATLTWDITPGSVGAGDSAITGGSGIWSPSAGVWTADGGATNVAWNHLGADTAFFGTTAGTVTLQSVAKVGGMTFNIDGYTLTGGQVALAQGTNTFQVVTGSAFLDSLVAGNSSQVLNKTGSGTLVIHGENTYSGGTMAGGGTIRLSNAGSVNAFGTGTITFTASTIIANGTSNTATIKGISNNVVINSGVFAGFDGGYKELSLNGNISGAGTLRASSSGWVILSGNNSYTGGTDLSVGTGTLRLASAQALGTTGSISFGTAGNNTVLQYTGANQVDYSSRIATNANAAIRVDTNGQEVTWAANLTNGGSANLRKLGAGILTLSGASSYTGATNVDAGQLNLIGTLTSAINVASGATLSGSGTNTGVINLASGTTLIADTVAVGGNGVTTAGAVTVYVKAAPTGSSATVDVIRYGSGASPGVTHFSASNYRGGTITDDTVNKKITLTYTGVTKAWNNAASANWDVATTGSWDNSGGNALFYWGDAVTFTGATAASVANVVGTVAPTSILVNNSNASGTYTINTGSSGVIAGTGSLTKSGTSTLTLSGTSGNRFTGGTTINAGILALGTGGTGANTSSVTALGTGAVTINSGGTLKLWIQNSTTFTIANNLVINGGTLAAEDGRYHMTGGVVVGSSGATFTSRYSGKYLRLDGAVSGAGGVNIFRDTASVTAYRDAVVILTANNTYQGTTTVGRTTGTTAGVLQIGDNTTTGTLGQGDVIVNTEALLRFKRADRYTVANAISGAGALAQDGTGTTALTASNTYTGGTSVITGTLLANNTGGSATGTGAVTVSTGARLGGIGAVAGQVSIATGATLFVGDGAGQGSLREDLTLSSGLTSTGTLEFDIFSRVDDVNPTTAADLLVMNSAAGGVISLSGTLRVNDLVGNSASTWNLNDTWQLIDWSAFRASGGTYSVNFTDIQSSLPTLDAAYHWEIRTTDAGLFVAIVVPEPSRALLLLLGLVGGLCWYRRR